MKTSAVIATFVLLAVAAALGFATSGWFDVSATARDPGWLRWLLQTTRESSVERRAADVAVPDLSSPKRVAAGANADCMASLVGRNSLGEITVSAGGSTNVAGLFAAGDVTDGIGKRIIIAAGEGARAALAAGAYLRMPEERTRGTPGHRGRDDSPQVAAGARGPR
jgi:hypothetical protein